MKVSSDPTRSVHIPGNGTYLCKIAPTPLVSIRLDAHEAPLVGAPRGRSGWPDPGGSAVLDLDLDVDAGREIESLERVDGLGGGVHDVEEPLVDPHLEVLAGVLVLVR
mgnify:CR=1 FL=1